MFGRCIREGVFRKMRSCLLECVEGCVGGVEEDVFDGITMERPGCPL